MWVCGDKTGKTLPPQQNCRSRNFSRHFCVLVQNCSDQGFGPTMQLLARIGILIFVCAAATVPTISAPFVPQSDSQVLERLPFATNDPVMRELSALRDRLKNEPHDLPL